MWPSVNPLYTGKLMLMSAWLIRLRSPVNSCAAAPMSTDEEINEPRSTTVHITDICPDRVCTPLTTAAADSGRMMNVPEGIPVLFRKAWSLVGRVRQLPGGMSPTAASALCHHI